MDMYSELFDAPAPDPAAARAAALRGVPLQPPPLSLAQHIANLQAQQEVAARRQQAAYQPIDTSQMQDVYGQQQHAGGRQLFAALAAQEAGMQPFAAQHLKQAAEMSAPMKMTGGTMTGSGFIQDPAYQQNLNIQRADARMQQIDRAMQSALTLQEQQRLTRERDAAAADLKRELLATRMENARALKAMAGSGDGLDKATLEGYTPEGKRVVTDKQGVPHVLDVDSRTGKATQTPYFGQVIPKATQEKNVATATEQLASADNAASLLKQLEGVDEKNFGWRGKLAAMSPDFLKSDVAAGLGVDPAARDVQANVMTTAAERIREMYGAAQSVGEAERAKTFLPTQGDDLATLRIKLRAAEKWARDHAARTGGAALNAATSRTGIPAAAGPLTVVRTGMRNGKRVQQMSDGSIRDAE